MRIFHVATAADWAQAQRTGRYTTSTRGRTLAEEGFVHAARADQWQGVRERYYADVTEPLVLLVVDTDRLSAPVVEETPPGAGETFPHVYGAIEADAVVQALPLDGAAPATATAPASPATPAPNALTPDPAGRTAPGGSTDAPRPFASLFLEEMSVRAGLGLLVIVVAVLAGLAVGSVAGDVATLVTILVLLVAGGLTVSRVLRRRERTRREADSSR